MPIKSFRGQLATSGIETINLHTNNGMIGYRIVKLELMPTSPGKTTYENVFKIFTIPQTTVTGTHETNYYIELETVALSDSQSTQLTLKNLRTIASR